MCVDPLRGEEDGHIELTWEAYLATAATCYRLKALVALKNVWLILQRMALTAQCASVAKGGTQCSPVAWPKDVLHRGFTGEQEGLDSCREASKAPAPASWLQNPHSGGRDWVSFRPRDTGGNKRCHRAVLLLKSVLTFKTTENAPGSGPLPWLLWGVCYGARVMAFHLRYQSSVTDLEQNTNQSKSEPHESSDGTEH